MKVLHLSILTIVFLSILIIPVFAQTQEISITASSDKGSDTITVMGKTISNLTDVTFRVTSPSGNNVVAIGAISPDSNGEFVTEFKVGSIWGEDGFYTITAMQSVQQNSLYTLSVEVEVINGMVASNTSVTKSNLEAGIIVSSEPKDTRDKGLEITAETEMGSNIIEIIGITDIVSTNITVTVVAPNGNIVSIDQVSPALNGEFTQVIEILNNSLWKQDGIYTVTAKQFDSSAYTASIEVDIKDKSVYPFFKNAQPEPIPENNKQKVVELKKELRQLENENSKLHSEINTLNLEIVNLNYIITEQIRVIVDTIKQIQR